MNPRLFPWNCSFSEGTLVSISQLLNKNKLVERCAISKELKKEARTVAF